MHPVNRLILVDPELVQYIQFLSEDDRRLKARLVAAWACNKSGADEFSLIKLVVDNLANNRDPSQSDIDGMRNLSDICDDNYFDLQSGHDIIDRETSLNWFSKARAITSLLYSVNSSEQISTCEAMYECYAATGEMESIRELIYAPNSNIPEIYSNKC